MKQIIVQKGKTLLKEVPRPKVLNKSILVKVNYSCISQGTEITSIRNSGRSELGKIIEKVKTKPNKFVSKAVNIIKDNGIQKTVKKVKQTSSPFNALQIGYSAVGIVKEVGVDIDDIKVGNKVACAGAGIANHAEYITVPRNLVIKVPDALDLKEASTVTLGGIAMQGVRRGNFKIGEFVVVLGLGFIGQLTVQILKASGCRVIAIDVDERRCKIASKYGAELTLNSSKYDKIEDKIYKITNGYGSDGVIFTAATSNPSVISSAFRMSKKKGKVVLVGVAGDTINRKDLYDKELDFLISTSYGPGRYDPQYEEEGIDYPYAYVRWTENRNMQEYLRLLQEKTIIIDDLIEKIYPLEKAYEAFNELMNSDKKPIIALFEYSSEEKQEDKKIEIQPLAMKDKKTINVAIIGAGNFAKTVHLPNLEKLKDKYNIYAICDLDSLNAKMTAEKYKANYATTDFEKILDDKNVNLVMICTRHNLHAKLSVKALKKGKAVFLEKPMAINKEELDKLVDVIKETNLPFMVGFNRRFSPFSQKIKKELQDRINPMMISYRMNAGYIPMGHWVHEAGGRIVGEACHIIDLFNYFTDSEIKSVTADKLTPTTQAISSEDNVSINVNYKDGSVANLIYTSLGFKDFPKEILEIFCDEKIIKMVDYAEIIGYGLNFDERELKKQNKGHLNELVEFYDFIMGKTKRLPISLDDMAQTTLATILINKG